MSRARMLELPVGESPTGTDDDLAPGQESRHYEVVAYYDVVLTGAAEELDAIERDDAVLADALADANGCCPLDGSHIQRVVRLSRNVREEE